MLAGIGPMSVILSVAGLLGRETPLDVRRSVIGLAGFRGSLGILMTSLAGGYPFDYRLTSGPIISVGGANLAAFVLALAVWLRSGRPVRFDPAEARSSSTMGALYTDGESGQGAGEGRSVAPALPTRPDPRSHPMLSFIFLLFAVIHLGLLGWGWRAWGPAGRPVALTILLIGNTLLWYDNFRIGMGRFIGEGDLLYNMSVPAFVWHWTMLPLLVIVAGSIARLAGLAWARNRIVMGAFCVVAVGLIIHDLPSALGLLFGGGGSLPAVELRPACIADTLRYSTKISAAQLCSPDATPFSNGPSSLPAIVMNAIMVGVGIALWVRHGWKWLVILPGLMFVAAGSGRLWGPYALPVANFGEILFTTGVLLTILRFSPGRRAQPAVSRQPAGTAAVSPDRPAQ